MNVYFEEQNLHSTGSDGELLLTILASYAQEESRSVSENCKWRIRNEFMKGNPTCGLQLYGYDYCDGKLVINPQEAEIVRMIYADYLSGMGRNAIMRKLDRLGVPTKQGGRWADFLTKKMVKNTGQVQQYYVEDSHPAIIHPDEFDTVQAEYERRKALGKPGRCAGPFAGKIICGECGGMYGRKVWGSYQNDKSHRRVIYRCDDKYTGENKCGTPHLTEKQIQDGFITAINHLLDDRKELLEDCRLAQATLCDVKAIDAELARLRQELEVVSELSRKEIHRNAHRLESQGESATQGYLERYSSARERIEALEKDRTKRIAKSKAIGRFIRSICGSSSLLTEFDETLWLATVDSVTVEKDSGMIYHFRNVSKMGV